MIDNEISKFKADMQKIIFYIDYASWRFKRGVIFCIFVKRVSEQAYSLKD